MVDSVTQENHWKGVRGEKKKKKSTNQTVKID